MSHIMKHCLTAILMQGLFIIIFQITLNIVLKITCVTNFIVVINSLLSLAAAFLAFIYTTTKEPKVICAHIITLALVLFLHLALAIFNLMVVINPDDLKSNIKSIVQEIFDLAQEHNEVAQRKIDVIQSKLGCCGVTSIVDYGIHYPQSCCEPRFTNCSLTNGNVYTRGCAHQAFFIIYNIEIIYTVTLIIFIIPLIVAVLYKVKELHNYLQMRKYGKVRDEVMGVQGRHCDIKGRGDIADYPCGEVVSKEIIEVGV